MAEDNVVADMDPNGEQFKAMLAGVQAGKVEPKVAQKVEKPAEKPAVKEPEPKVEKADVKSEAASSSDTADSKVEVPEGDAEDTVDTLKKQISGLKAELTKRKGQHDKVEELEKQLNTLQAELKGRKDVTDATDPDAKLKASIHKLSKEELTEERLIWQERQADARAAIRIAQRDGDTEAAEKAATELATTRKVLKAIEIGHEELAVRKQSEQAGEKELTEKLTTEVESIFNDAFEKLPDLKNPESELYKAGDAEFRKRPVLMKAMGQSMGELVSLAYAILRNPALVTPSEKSDGKKEQAVRKDLVNSLDEKISKAFVKGGGSQGTKVTPNYSELAETNLTEFEKLVNKAKGG